METIGPHTRTIPVHCAPRKAPCPSCGKLGRRKDIHNRFVRTIAYKQVVYLDVTYGEYRARCGCCTTFRTTPPGVEPRALYDNKVRLAVLDRILDDGMKRAERGDRPRCEEITSWTFPMGSSTTASIGRSDNSTSPNIAALCLNASAAPSASTSCTSVARLCCWRPTRSRTCRWPSPWSPAMTRTIWRDGFSRTSTHGGFQPEGCRDRWLQPLSHGPGRVCGPTRVSSVVRVPCPERPAQEGAGRREEAAAGDVPARNCGCSLASGDGPKSRGKRRKLSNKDKAAFVFKHRWLIVKRRDEMKPARAGRPGHDALLPARIEGLARLRGPPGEAVRGGPKRVEGSASTRAALLGARSLQAIPELAAAIEMLPEEKFAKMIAFLKSPACRRVRTNNHVERINRQASLRGEVALQVAEASNDRAVLGADAGPNLAARASDAQSMARRFSAGTPQSVITETYGTRSSCVIGQSLSASARSVLFLSHSS